MQNMKLFDVALQANCANCDQLNGKVAKSQATISERNLIIAELKELIETYEKLLSESGMIPHPSDGRANKNRGGSKK